MSDKFYSSPYPAPKSGVPYPENTPLCRTPAYHDKHLELFSASTCRSHPNTNTSNTRVWRP